MAGSKERSEEHASKTKPSGELQLAPGARRHVARLLRAIEPRSDALKARLGRQLRAFGPAAELIVAITPAAAANCVSLDVFFAQVERRGRALARMGVTPEQVTATLRDTDRFLAEELEDAFQPAREQLQLATTFALYRAYYETRQEEVRRLQTLARRAEEQERRRIGRELHDEAGQSLLLLRLQLEMLGRAAPPRLRAGLGEARATAERVVVELRRIVAALSPSVLERLGLVPALRQLAARFEKACGIATTVRVRGAVGDLAPDVQEVIYRVAQESLQNTAKHARATAVNLSLHSTDREIRLRAADNGAGFVVEPAGGRPMSFGLAGMRERAALLGGVLAVRSAPGKGTQIVLRLPGSARVTLNGQNSCASD